LRKGNSPEVRDQKPEVRGLYRGQEPEVGIGSLLHKGLGLRTSAEVIDWKSDAEAEGNPEVRGRSQR